MSEPVATGSLAGQYDVALLDLDGVVYLGDVAVAGASEALASRVWIANTVFALAAAASGVSPASFNISVM